MPRKQIKVRTRRHPRGHHVGEITMPMHMGCITTKSVGFDPASALKRASAMALSIVQDPRVGPFIPSEVTDAVIAVNKISKLSEDGLKEVSKHPDADKGAKKVASKLAKSASDVNRQYTGWSLPNPVKALRSAFGGGSGNQMSKRQFQQLHPTRYGEQRGWGPMNPPGKKYNPNTVPTYYDMNGNPVQNPQIVYPIQYDMYGNPIPQYFDGNGNPYWPGGAPPANPQGQYGGGFGGFGGFGQDPFGGASAAFGGPGIDQYQAQVDQMFSAMDSAYQEEPELPMNYWGGMDRPPADAEGQPEDQYFGAYEMQTEEG